MSRREGDGGSAAAAACEQREPVQARAKLVRPHGSGSVTCEGGRFRARLPGSKESLGSFDSKEEAQSALDARVAALRAAPPDARNWTLARWMRRYVEVRKVMRLRNAPVNDTLNVEAHIVGDDIGRLPIGALGEDDVHAWMLRMCAKPARRPGKLRRGLGTEPRSGKTVANLLTLLRTGLEHAVEMRVLTHNPARGVRVPKSMMATTEVDYEGVLWPDELAAVLIEAEAHFSRLELAPMVRVAIGTGMRKMELLRLRWVDVHLDASEPYVVVRYGSDRGGSGGRRGPTKRGKPRRVPLIAIAHAALVDVRRAREAERARGAHEGSGNPRWKSEYVFPGIWGNARSKVPEDAWHEALERAGISRRVRWHDLKHSCGTWLLEGVFGAQWSVQEVQQQLAHAQVSTTERYLHARNTLAFRAAARMRTRDAKETFPETSLAVQVGRGERSVSLGRNGVSGVVPAQGFESRTKRRTPDE